MPKTNLKIFTTSVIRITFWHLFQFNAMRTLQEDSVPLDPRNTVAPPQPTRGEVTLRTECETASMANVTNKTLIHGHTALAHFV